jgi:hypothetical protein
MPRYGYAGWYVQEDRVRKSTGHISKAYRELPRERSWKRDGAKKSF